MSEESGMPSPFSVSSNVQKTGQLLGVVQESLLLPGSSLSIWGGASPKSLGKEGDKCHDWPLFLYSVVGAVRISWFITNQEIPAAQRQGVKNFWKAFYVLES